MNNTDVLDHVGGSISDDDMIKCQVQTTQGYTPMTAMAAQQERAHEICKQWYLTLAFLMGADRAWLGHVLGKLDNEFIQGQDRYPKMLKYSVMISCRD